MYRTMGLLKECGQWTTCHIHFPSPIYDSNPPHIQPYQWERDTLPKFAILILTHPTALVHLKFRSQSPRPPSRPSGLCPTISIFYMSFSAWCNCVYSHSLEARKGNTWHGTYPWWSLVTLAKWASIKCEVIKSWGVELKRFFSSPSHTLKALE